MTVMTCAACSLQIDDSECSSIACDICDKWFHSQRECKENKSLKSALILKEREIDELRVSFTNKKSKDEQGTVMAESCQWGEGAYYGDGGPGTQNLKLL
ncbi:hypothetical protein J6590_049039 [Homalodisca vitripennis]|nr:hypothetical protein J6590_049039 [Homalodisca vitripennis]